MSAATVFCPVCGSAEHEVVLSLQDLPVLINAQVRPDEALSVPRGDMELAVCHRCSHLFNVAFDEQLMAYDAAYENTLHFSPAFQGFAKTLADRLVADHSLVGEHVAELGSGPGHFLSMLCDRGVTSAYGFDPSYDPQRLGAPEHPGVTLRSDLFPADGSLSVRMAFSQHVLEHLESPVAGLRVQGSAVANGGVVYTEVPNGQLMIDECALWDLIYEHRSYFVPQSLSLACRLSGLAVSEMGTAFADQFLWCEAQPSDEAIDAVQPDAPEEMIAGAVQFGRDAVVRIARARDELAAAAAVGPVALWGAGSKGATYLNLVARDTPVAAVIDINPRKLGWGVPGTSLVISDPESLVDIQPATVLVANPVYRNEIATQLDELGVTADVRTLWGADQ